MQRFLYKRVHVRHVLKELYLWFRLLNYKKAEQVASFYTVTLSGSNRLYNTLGALYYETGNYRQAKNYFEKLPPIVFEATIIFVIEEFEVVKFTFEIVQLQQ